MREKRSRTSSRLAAAKVAGVQAAVADRVLLAQPGEEALETETVAAVGAGTIPEEHMLVRYRWSGCGYGMTYFLWSVYQ
jgi:hypothetical protein